MAEPVNAIAANNDARDHGCSGHVRKAGHAMPHGRPFQHRAYAVPDAGLGKHAKRVPCTEPSERGAHRLAVEPGAVDGEGIDATKPGGSERVIKKLQHGHPVDLSPGGDTDEGRVEMADMIRGHDPGALAARELRAQHMDFDNGNGDHFRNEPRDVVKQNPHWREAR